MITEKDLSDFKAAVIRLTAIICDLFIYRYDDDLTVTRDEMKAIAKVTGVYGQLMGRDLIIDELQTAESLKKRHDQQVERERRAAPLLDRILAENHKHNINFVPNQDMDTRSFVVTKQQLYDLSDFYIDRPNGRLLYGMRIILESEQQLVLQDEK